MSAAAHDGATPVVMSALKLMLRPNVSSEARRWAAPMSLVGRQQLLKTTASGRWVVLRRDDCSHRKRSCTSLAPNVSKQSEGQQTQPSLRAYRADHALDQRRFNVAAP